MTYAIYDSAGFLRALHVGCRAGAEDFARAKGYARVVLII